MTAVTISMRIDQLDRIERKVDQIMTSFQDLDAALAQLATDVSNVKTAVEALIAAIPPGVSTAEVQQVKDALASIEQTTAEAQGATPPPPPQPV